MISAEDKAKLRRLMELRQKRDEDKAQATRSENEYRDHEADVIEALNEGGMDRLNNVDIGPPWGKVSFHSKETHYGKILDEGDAKEWIRSVNMTQALTEPKIVMGRINDEVRTRIETGDTKMPPGIGYYTKHYVQITRQKD